MKIGVLTSVDTRHRYFVNRLRAELGVVAVGYERIGYAPDTVGAVDLGPNDARIVAEHFAERSRQEQHFFGPQSEFVQASDACAVNHIEPGELNSQETLHLLEAARVDAVAVFGTNLIKPPLLDRWPGRMINLHLGLSPYYRGTATNFFPLLNEEPEYVGATIHLLDARIDAGPILAHARPTIVADDMPHTIGCKAVVAGIDKMITVLRELEQGRLAPVQQWEVPNPRLYLRRDYHPRQVVELYEKIENGLIPRYVERAAQVAPLIRLVE